MIRNTFSPFNVAEPASAHTTIKESAENDRPREKLMSLGAEALTNAELLAILIGGGTTNLTAVELMQSILGDCDNSLANLQRMSIGELMQYKGIGEAKALTILATAELGRRRTLESVNDLQKIKDSSDVFSYMKPRVQDLACEKSWVLLLNNSCRIIRCVELSRGGLTETSVDARVVFHHACIANATSVILVHNHPSGNVRPSKMDDELTMRIQKIGQMMNIRLFDHVVMTDNDYFSYAEEGKL